MRYKIYKALFRSDGAFINKQFIGEVDRVKSTIRDTVELVEVYRFDGWDQYYIEAEDGLKILNSFCHPLIISEGLEVLDWYPDTQYDMMSTLANLRLFREIEAKLRCGVIEYSFNCTKEGQRLIKQWNQRHRRNDVQRCIGYNTHRAEYLFTQKNEVEDTLCFYEKRGYKLINK